MNQTHDSLLAFQPAEAESGGLERSVFLFISLYSLLLAFFILLYTVAEISASKADATKASVQDSFRGKAAAAAHKTSITQGLLGAEVVLRQYYTQMGKVTRSQLQLEPTAMTQVGDTMVMRIPVALFFVEGSSVLEDRKWFLKSLVDMVVHGPIGLKAKLTFVAPFSLGAEPAKEGLAMQRGAVLARRLMELGLSENNVQTGYAEGKREMLEVVFSPDAGTEKAAGF